MFAQIQQQWLSNIRGDVLAGLVVGLALIPEAIAFLLLQVSIHRLAFTLLFRWQ